MSKPTTKPVLPLSAAIALASTFAATNAETIGEQVNEVEGGTLTLQSFSNHQAFAEQFYNICDLDGKVKTAVSKRSEAMKAKTLQFRVAVLTLESGEIVQKIGATVINDKGEQVAKEVNPVPLFFHNTEPQSLLLLANQNAININYQLKPKPLALAQLIDSHPKLADFAAIEGLTLKPASKESVIVSFASEEAFDAYWLAVSNILPENRLKSAGEMVQFKMAGVDMPFSPLARTAFKMSFSGRFESVESQATLLLVS
ncbi:MAG: hypothetical protein WC107_07960 [Patescibacteria group bacterium]|jgi:hypothetical protein